LYGVSYFVKEWGKAIHAWTDMPLVPFIYGLVFRLFGEARVYIQILTTTLFSLSVVLTYELGKTLWDEETGFFAGVFLAGMPYLLTQVPLMLVDVPTMFFLMLAVVTFIRAIEKGALWRIMTASITIALAFFAKYSIWLMFSVLLIAYIIYVAGAEKQKTRESANSPEILLRGLSIALIAFIFIGVVFLYKFDVFRDQIRLLIAYQRPGLSRWQESFVSTFLFQIHPLITLSAMYSIYTAVRKKDFKFAIVAWLVFLLVMMQIKRIRYIIMVFPMIALMASYGIRELGRKDMKRFLVFSVFFSSLVVGFFVYLPFLTNISTVNLKDAGNFVNSLEAPAIEVFTLRPEDLVINPAVSVPILDIFTKKDIIYHYDKEKYLQPKDTIERSSLRFSWEYKNPSYYNKKDYDYKDVIVVVISESPDDALPEEIGKRIVGYELTGVFKSNEDIFIYRPCVRVYQRSK
jgi:uncharacterized membrane protein